jgi:DNA polymerase III alpha subunit (gram-positive type)
VNNHTWIAFDCETTGFLPRGRLIELAGVCFDDDGSEPRSTFQMLVRPPVPIPQEISDLTGITQQMVVGATDAASAVRAFSEWLTHDSILVAHNLPFDLAILELELPGIEVVLRRRAIDSLSIARALGEFPDNRLSTIARQLQGSSQACHRALSDAMTVRALILHSITRGLPDWCPELFEPESM